MGVFGIPNQFGRTRNQLGDGIRAEVVGTRLKTKLQIIQAVCQHQVARTQVLVTLASPLYGVVVTFAGITSQNLMSRLMSKPSGRCFFRA